MISGNKNDSQKLELKEMPWLNKKVVKIKLHS